ncbi:MAG: hypothetical protein Q8J92_02020 [Parvibaculum sp.]|nr:hypothetical protein [Parvibaculum sp.]
MKRALVVALFLSIGTAALAEAPSMKGAASPDQEFLYLAGVASGIGYTNAALIMNGRTPLYCAPNDYVLNVQEVKRIAALNLTGPVEPQLYSVAVVTWLSENYPCEM